MPADVDVFTVRVCVRVSVFGGAGTVEGHAQHVERKGFIAERLNALEEFFLAARIGPDNQQGIRQVRAGIRLDQLVVVTVDANRTREATVFFTPGIDARFAGADDLAVDLVDVHYIYQAQELGLLQQRIAQLRFFRRRQRKITRGVRLTVSLCQASG